MLHCWVTEDNANPEATAALFAKWMELRMTDLAVVMDDFVNRATQAADKFGSADISRFVTLGHSAGGHKIY